MKCYDLSYNLSHFKLFVDHQGDWALFESSKGRRYYFNIKTQSNQWVKPTEWIEKSNSNPNFPVPPPPTTNHQSSVPPPLPPPNNHENGSGFKMKIK